MPKGSWLKRYRPNSVMKVVRREDAGARGTSQNPEFASSFVNNIAPADCDFCARIDMEGHHFPF